MASPLVLKSRKQGFMLPVQILDTDVTPVAGRRVDICYLRARGKFPPREYLRGRSNIGTGKYDPSYFYIWPGYYRLRARGKFPPRLALCGRASIGVAHPPPWVESQQTYFDNYRVENTTLEQYELYIGEDGSPNLSGSPDATSATLPFSHTISPPVSGETNFHCVVRKRNAYDLISLNQYERIIIVDDNGDEVIPDPSSPVDVELLNWYGEKVVLNATYNIDNDISPANTWSYYVTDNGVDPIPGVDPEIEEDMHSASVPQRLHVVFGPYADATDIRVIVRTKRSSDNVTDGNTTVYQLITAEAPGTPSGNAFQ